MALVTYHGPRPEITASFPMRDGDMLTFANGRPSEVKKPGPHSYVLPKDHPVPVGAVFAVGLAVLVRTRAMPLTVRLAPGDWALACERLPGLQRVTPRMLATPRRRRLLGAMLRRREGAEVAVVQRVSARAWRSPFAAHLGDKPSLPCVTYLRRFYRLPVAPVLRWPRRALASLRWDPQVLRASSTYNLSVNEDLNWRPRG